MTVSEPRVWLLPNGNPVTRPNEDGPFLEHPRAGIQAVSGGDYSRWWHNTELPEGAAPLVALPRAVPVDWDDHGYVGRHREPFAEFPSVILHKDTTVAELRKHIDHLAAELSDQLAALELLELERDSTESGAEAARRKVLRALKPGAYALQVSQKRTRAVIVTVDGRLMLATPTGVLEDWTDRYGDPHFLGSAPQLTLLAEGDLSPAVAE